jgi:hypothetical protein
VSLVELNLSTAIFASGGSGPLGQWDGTGIVTLHGFPDFFIPGFTVDPAQYYQFEATYDTTDPGDFDVTNGFWVFAAAGDNQTDYDASTFDELYNNDRGSVTVHTFTMGPGLANWDTETAAGRVYPIFESDSGGRLIRLRYQVVAQPGPPVYSIDRLVIPAGGATIGTATPISPGSVSFPHPGSVTDDGVDTDPHAWFKLAAPEPGGDVVYSTNLSYEPTFPFVTSSIVAGFYSGPADATSIGDLTSVSSGTEDTITLAAGQTYYFRLRRDPVSEPAAVLMVFQLGSYRLITDWIQDEDLAWVLSTGDGDGLVHPRVLPPVTSGGFGSAFGAQHVATFMGSYTLSQSLGGPAPSDDANCYDVLWRNARSGQAGGDWWSEDPLNPDIDIHASWHGGPGTPVHKDDGRFLPGKGLELDDFVGVTYHVDKFTGSLEWEADASELVGLAAAPDDTTVTDTTSGACLVYAKVVPTEDEDGWGPAAYATDNGMSGDADEWAGGLDQPMNFPAKQDVNLTVGGAWDGGSTHSPWTDLTSLIEAILAQEAADEATSIATHGSYDGALRFVSIPDSLPIGGPPVGPDPDDDLVSGRNHQAIALRLTMRPARHRWVGVPTLVTPDSVDLTVTGDPDDVRRRFY